MLIVVLQVIELCFQFHELILKWDVNFQRQPVTAAKHNLASGLT